VGGLLRGVWHAHVGWLFVHDVPDWARYVPDLLRDPVLFRLNQLYLVFIGLGLAIPAAAGGIVTGTWAGALSGLLWGGLVRIFLVHHAVWSVNSLCHLFGRKDYPTPDQSTNNAWLVIPSLGASWHNNHHAFLKSASLTFEWWQIDVHYAFIKAMQWIGWAKNPHHPSPDLIRSRRLPEVLVDVITPTGQRA
jgi:stearoyl-CoA desaturase (delta-9 desaturase)